MNDDEILKVLAKAANDQSHHSQELRWESLTRGTATSETVSQLQTLAQSNQREALRHELYRPIDATRKDAIASKIVEEIGKQSLGEDKPRKDRPAQAAGTVVPLRRRWKTTTGWIVGPLALAATLALWLQRPPSIEGLPSYSLTLTGTDQQYRGEEPKGSQSDLHVTQGRKLTAILRPERSVEGPVAVHAFLSRGGQVIRLDAQTELSSDGAVRMTTSIASPAVTEGTWNLVIAVGRPGVIPSDPQAFVGKSSEGSSASWQVLRYSLRVDAPK